MGDYDAINGTGGVCHVQNMVIERPGAGEVKQRFAESRSGPIGYLRVGLNAKKSRK